MDDLTVSELFAGLTNPSFQSQKTLLLQFIANKFAESNPEDIVLDSFIRYFLLDIHQQLVSNRTRPVQAATNHITYTLLILQNLTSYESNCKIMLNMILETSSTFDSSVSAAWIDILNSFLDYDPLSEQYFREELVEAVDKEEFWSLKDPLQHMSFLICNLSQYEEYREVFMKRSLLNLPRLLPQVHTQVTAVIVLLLCHNCKTIAFIIPLYLFR